MILFAGMLAQLGAGILLFNAINEVDRTESTFHKTFRAFVATIVDETAHRTLMDYMREL